MIIDKVKQIISNPTGFFESLSENGIKDCYVYFLLVSLVYAVLGTILSVAFRSFGFAVLPADEAALGVGIAFASGIGSWIAGLVFIFVGIAIWHVWLMIFGARVPFEKTMQTSIYAATPFYVFGWIPILGVLAGIWTMVLNIIALPKTHGLSTTKSVIAVLLPSVLIVMFAVTLIALIAGAAFSGLPAF